MNAKAKLKIVLDVAMTLALLFLMGYPWWGDVAHEWAGAGMFALFIAHHILNAGWWRSLGKGRYTPARVLQLVIDLLVLPAMLGLMGSGVMLSNHVFAFLPISGGMSFARLLHGVGLLGFCAHVAAPGAALEHDPQHGAPGRRGQACRQDTAHCRQRNRRCCRGLWSCGLCPPRPADVYAGADPLCLFLITANRSRCFTSTIWP